MCFTWVSVKTFPVESKINVKEKHLKNHTRGARPTPFFKHISSIPEKVASMITSPLMLSKLHEEERRDVV